MLRIIVFMYSEFDFWKKTIYHNSIEEWMTALAILIVTIVAARIVYLFLSRVLKIFTRKSKTNLDDLLLEKLKAPVMFLMILAGLNFALERLQFSTRIESYIHRGYIFITAISITWLLVRIAYSFIEEFLRPYSQRNSKTMDAQVVLLTERGVGLLLWTLGIIAGLSNAGFDVGALIAGLGIGGLALALAAQDTVKNIFGGVMIFLDKPFKMGERIKVGSYDGFVEHVGIRSTRIRTLENRIVTIPNAQFSDSAIENISVEPSFKVNCTLGLDYSTPPDKMEEAMNILKEITLACPLVHSEEFFIYFGLFNAYSLDIKFTYFVKKEADILQAQNDMNMEILRRFNTAGLSLAFPTQTVISK